MKEGLGMAALGGKKKAKNKTKRNRNTFIMHRAGERKPHGGENVLPLNPSDQKRKYCSLSVPVFKRTSAEIWDESSLHHHGMVNYFQSELRFKRMEIIVMLMITAAVAALKKHCVEHLMFALIHLILTRMLPLLLLSSSWF